MVAPDVEIDDGKGTSLFTKLHLYEINVLIKEVDQQWYKGMMKN